MELLAHDPLEPRYDYNSAQRAHSGSPVKDDENAEHIVRSSILKLLREDGSSNEKPSELRSEGASLGASLDDIWTLRPKTHGSPMRFKA